MPLVTESEQPRRKSRGLPWALGLLGSAAVLVLLLIAAPQGRIVVYRSGPTVCIVDVADAFETESFVLPGARQGLHPLSYSDGRTRGDGWTLRVGDRIYAVSRWQW